MHLCTIEVTGPPDVICERERELIEMYFENKFRGGPIDEITFKENVCYVTFDSKEGNSLLLIKRYFYSTCRKN